MVNVKEIYNDIESIEDKTNSQLLFSEMVDGMRRCRRLHDMRGYMRLKFMFYSLKCAEFKYNKSRDFHVFVNRLKKGEIYWQAEHELMPDACRLLPPSRDFHDLNMIKVEDIYKFYKM